MEREIIIKPKFDFKTLFSANLYLLILSQVSSLILFTFYVLFVFSFLIILFLDDNNSEFLDGIISKPSFFIIFLLPLFFLFFIYYSSKKQLSSNYRIKENLEFIFNSDFFQEKGETFDIKHYWDKLLEVKERKNYFLIYQNKRRANVIPKDSFNNENQLLDFKELIKSINIKSNLKS